VVPPDAIGPIVAIMPRLPEASQVKLLAVLAGYPGETVLRAITDAARGESHAVRIAASKALQSAGDASVVPLLVESAATARGSEQAAARSALGMLKGRAVDESIVRLMAGEPTEDVATELLLAIAGRRIFAAKSVVASSMASSSAKTRVQALRTMRTVGTPSDIPAVLDALLGSSDDSDRTEAEATTTALAQKIASMDRRSAAIKARLAKEEAPEAKIRLMGLLPLIGDSSSLPVLRAALEDDDADVFDAAVRAMAAWPTGAARDDVLRLARESRNETHRLLAIQGLVRIVGVEKHREPRAAVADLREAAACAWRPEEQKLILGALAQFPCAEGIDLATGFLREPSVEAEAQAAIDRIKPRLEAMRKAGTPP
jgi:hypothetical protein